jgi:dipeptidyl-peptidase 4
MKPHRPAFALLCLLVSRACAQGTAEDYARAEALAERSAGGLYRAQVDPRWLPGGTSFWYRVEVAAGEFETVHVGAETGTRTPGFTPPAAPPGLLTGPDAPTASQSGGKQTGLTVVNRRTEAVKLFWLDTRGRRKPYGEIPAGGERAFTTYTGHAWLMADGRGRRLAVCVGQDEESRVVIDDTLTAQAEARTAPRGPRRDGGASPDGAWRAEIRGHNVVLTSADQRRTVALTTDGRESEAYGGALLWSPDSRHLAVHRIRPAEERRITFVEALPKDSAEPRVHTIAYDKPGDPMPEAVVVVLDVEARTRAEVPASVLPDPRIPGGTFDMEWSPDGRELWLEFNSRRHALYQLLAVNPATGATRVVAEERFNTFVDYTNKIWKHPLEEGRALLWMSERDGWAHLLRIDTATGRVRNAVTRGEWVVRAVESVDEAAGHVWFWASGVRPEQSPYHLHLCRVNLDGTGLVVLTEGDGTHRARFSPDRRWFVDTWSRVDQPPVNELRRSSDGLLVAVLERGDDQARRAASWTVPERFVAPGRDGRTPIHGILVTPSNLDPHRKYPVIEEIYAGPQDAHVPVAYGRLLRAHQLAELGFVVVQIDGMGTNHRGKAFHDVCWKNLGDAGFPDRIAWMRAAAATRPWMDLTRVGIFGGSAGGQNAVRALIAHPEFYRAAAADCGCHDNRVDKRWWNEQWMSWPLGPHYAEQSNVTQAHRLRGDLLLTVGEIDDNVDPASTYQLSAALVRANRDFDLVILPSEGHGAGESAYGSRRRADFFVRKLLGVEPRR